MSNIVSNIMSDIKETNQTKHITVEFLDDIDLNTLSLGDKVTATRGVTRKNSFLSDTKVTYEIQDFGEDTTNED